MGAAGHGLTDLFAYNPASRWRFFADTVMGGISSGEVTFDIESGRSFARMTGLVSTANNGGFIQMQRQMTTPLQAGMRGVRLIARGNDQRYSIHLRSVRTRLPMAFYRASFDAVPDWLEIRLGFDEFTASNAALPARIVSEDIAAIAVVAYGRDHEADISVSEIGFY